MAVELVKKAVEKHGKKRESLMPILQDIVKEERYLSEDVMAKVAEELELSSAEVFGVASFYSFLPTEELGKNVIRICQTITCDMKGKEKIVEALENKLNIKMGETTKDKKFSLLPANCIGWCNEGPAMLINDDVYTKLTPESAVKAVEDIQKGGK